MFTYLVVLMSFVALAFAACPNGIIEKGVNSTYQSIIVNRHNDIRLMIANGTVPNQPKGIDLLRMSWDTALASAAQRISDNCEYQHVTVTDGRWTYVGQNIYIRYSTGSGRGADWLRPINSWYDEYAQYTYSNTNDPDALHYTQLVWAKTYKIGCGYTMYEKGTTYKYNKLYVCNYGPGGNIRGQYPYRTGTSGCPNLC